MGKKGASAGVVAGKIGLAALFLLLFCIVSGRPLLYSDSKAYFTLGQEIGKMLKVPGPALAIPAAAASPAPSPAASNAATDISLRGRALSDAERAKEERLAYTVAGSRSPYYSLYLFLGWAVGGLWLVVFLQGLLAAAVLWTLARVMTGGRGYLAMMAALAIASSLPIFSMLILADIFAGIGIIAAALLIAYPAELRGWERIFLWLALTASCLFHPTHMMVAGLLGGIGLLIALLPRWRRPGQLVGSLAVIGAALTGLAGMIAYPMAVKALRGETVYSPPFLAARVIADGPGRNWLRAHCQDDDTPFALCRFRHQPLAWTDDILWSAKPGVAVFQVSDYDQRVRIIKEQPAFVLAVLRSDPAGVLDAMARHVAQLSIDFSTDEALGDPTHIFRDPEFRLFGDLVPGGPACRDGTASCAPRIGPGIMNPLVGAGLALALAGIVATFAGETVDRRRWTPLLALLLGGLMLNAIVCGALSGPAPRYQSRLTWLIPAAAVLMVATARRRRRVDEAAVAAA